MADINKLKDKIKSTIYPNGKGAINAADHQAMLLDMADGMAETDTKLAELSKELESKVDKSEVPIPDWDAAEDEAGYIKNRTHYKEAVERAFVGIEKGDYILDAEGNPDGWESWVEAGGIEDENAKVSLPVTIAFGLGHLNFELTFDHVGQQEILEYEEYDSSYASILEVGIDEKEGECYLHFTTRGCGTPWLYDGEEIDVRIESFKRLDDEYIPSTIVRKSDLEGLSAEIDSQNQLIEDLQNTKIDKEADDYYPQLSVGLADNLAGVDVVDSAISFRRSGGGAISNGTARIEAIKGNSVVWNQLARSPLFDNSEESWSYNRDLVSATLLDNGEIYAKGKGVHMLGSEYISPRVPLVSGHAYLYRLDIKKNISETLGVYLGDVWNNPTMGKPIDADIWYHLENISVPTENLDRGLWVYPWNNTELTDCEAWIKNVVVYDLTQMFGAGNEPTTIEEFNARKPLGIDENAYNEGEVIHMNAQSLVSCNVDSTICKEQSLDVVRKYFPEGMKSAGTGHDEIRYNKATQKWEKVEAVGVRAYQDGDADNNAYLTDGKVTCYPLAEPIVTEIEGDFNLDYEVWNGGTEKIVSDVPTTPLKADIAYGFNAVGKIKELEEKINSGGGGGVSKEYVDSKVTELSAEIGNKVDAEFVNNAIAEAITTTLNAEV